MQGRIVSLSCGVYYVECDKTIYRVSARGLFRSIKIKPVVGDFVELDKKCEVIMNVLPRSNFLKRPPIANIDQMIIVASLVEPEFSYLLTFKHLTYANMNNVEAKIILTKEDKFNDEAKLQEIVQTFKTMNIETYVISNKTKEGLKEVKELFKGKLTCLLGQSGVGKSSFINAMDESLNRNIGSYSEALGRGKHETKEVILLPFLDGLIADTPGFSSLELDLYKEDLAIYFPGFNKIYTDCYYSNCLHISENKCAIKEEIAKGNIPNIAYDCYLKLQESAIFKARRYQK